MIDQLLAMIAPHHCSGCALYGTLLCGNCKYDIVSETFGGCLSCGRLAISKSGICGSCQVAYTRAWCAGERKDTAERLINSYKFSNVKAAASPLTEILDAHLPALPPDTVIIPIPTIASHIRQRGYDHMLLVARRLAKARQLTCDTSLVRATSTRQRDAGRQQRIQQAKEAFRCTKQLDPAITYLLVDDVVTTGSTLHYAATCLRAAGASTVWAVSITRQPLD